MHLLRVSSIPFVLSALLLACSNTACAISFPNVPSRTFPASAQKPENSIIQLDTPGKDHTFPSLGKRVDLNLHLRNGWLMEFAYVNSMLPLRFAAATFEDFYQRLLDKVNVFAATTQPLKAVSLFVGDVHLDFYCSDSVISWDFIKTFITTMLDATRKGFAARFDALMYHGQTDTFVTIGLRIISMVSTPSVTDSTSP
ncbi:hypothetical protein MMC28_007778 [Mycoblastus sanguinarius]|nr:hypothetical protein [Mycoblastus sanguinarius]